MATKIWVDECRIMLFCDAKRNQHHRRTPRAATAARALLFDDSEATEDGTLEEGGDEDEANSGLYGQQFEPLMPVTLL